MRFISLRSYIKFLEDDFFLKHKLIFVKKCNPIKKLLIFGRKYWAYLKTIFDFNPDYTLGLVMRVKNSIK
jgi:hypothetical protein